MANLRLSKYVVCVDISNALDQVLVFSTISTAAVLLPGFGGKPDIGSLSESETQQLRDAMILTTSDDEDREFLEYWVRRNRFGHRSMAVTVFTTRRCNLRCTYCYQAQENVPVPAQDMSIDTAALVADWICSWAGSRDSSPIFLTLYGGEPLCNLEAIRTIGSRLTNFCRADNRRFETFVVTNGTLVTDDAVLALRHSNLALAQVTLDGPREVHDSRRIAAAGQGSFDQVIEGLTRLSSICRVSIRINVDPNTVPYVQQLLEYLAGLGLATKRNLVALAETCTIDAMTGDASSAFSPHEFASATANVIMQARRLGFRYKTRSTCLRVSPLGRVHSCSTWMVASTHAVSCQDILRLEWEGCPPHR